MSRRLLRLLIVLSPFTSWFAVSGWLRLPVVLGVLLLLVTLPGFFQNSILKPQQFFRDTEDLLLIGFLACVLGSFVFARGQPKAFNHFLSYFFVLISFFFSVKHAVRFNEIDLSEVLKMITNAAWLLNGVLFVEFFVLNLIDFDPRPYLVWTGGEGGVRTIIGGADRAGLFHSASGPSEEPGSTAIFLNIYTPIALGYLYKNESRKLFFRLFSLYVFSVVVLTSAAGIAFMLLPGIFVWFSRNLSVTRFFSISAKFILSFILVAGLFSQMPQSKETRKFIKLFQRLVVLKVTLSDKDKGTSMRLNTWIAAFENTSNAPYFGLGPGAGSVLFDTGYHSAFLTVMADTGLLSLSFFLLFLAVSLIKIQRLKSEYRPFFLWAFLAGVAHLNIVGDYFHLHFWLLLIVIQKAHLDGTNS